MEFLRFVRGERKEVFTPTNEKLWGAAEEINDRIFHSQYVVTDSKEFEGGVDFRMPGKGNQEVIFSLCVGTNSTFYMNKHLLREREEWIYKSKPNEDIKSLFDLTETVRSFVVNGAKPEEIIDVSKKELLRLMHVTSDGLPQKDLNFIKNLKKEKK